MMSSSTIKLSSPATREFWQIPVLFEDAHLLAFDKPAGLLASPDRNEPERANLTTLLHAGIAAGKPWAQERALAYLMNAYRLDAETSGVILFAKFKSVFVALADFFGAGQSGQKYLALVRGAPREDCFEVDAKLAPHPTRPGLMRVDVRDGKRAVTRFELLEKFAQTTLLRCEPLTLRPHQIRVHLCHVGMRLVGDGLYGGKPLWLSQLKPDFRLKEGKIERPLISRAALHAEQLLLPHPVNGEPLTLTAPWPKDMKVAVKYLRRFAK